MFEWQKQDCKKNICLKPLKACMDKFNYKNVMEIPKIGENCHQYGRWRSRWQQQKHLESAVSRPDRQSPARNLLSPKQKNPSRAFKLRQGMPIGRKSYSARRPHVLTSSTN